MRTTCKTCTAALARPELLHIGGRHFTYGANQLWFPTSWQRKAGCGPTAASHLLWYLSQAPGAEGLCAHDGSTRTGFLRLMEEVWRYVTPGVMGVNCTGILTEGAERYGRHHGVPLRSRVLEVSAVPMTRPGPEAVAQFLMEAFADDLPVAFLNLSNGALRNLDGWHWVTLVGLDPQRMAACMYDQGARSEIDLALWLRTTTLGGGFVTLEQG